MDGADSRPGASKLSNGVKVLRRGRPNLASRVVFLRLPIEQASQSLFEQFTLLPGEFDQVLGIVLERHFSLKFFPLIIGWHLRDLTSVRR